MRLRIVSQGVIQEGVQVFLMLGMQLKIRTDLKVELGNKQSLQRKVCWTSKSAWVYKYLEIISFKQIEETFANNAS